MATIPLILPDALADDPSVATGVIVLEGVRYRLTFRWSPRDDRDGQWRLDVSDAAGVLRLAGVPLVTSEDVFAPYHYKGRGVPPGRLRVTVDPDLVTGARRDPGLHDLGRAARLEYVESADAAT